MDALKRFSPPESISFGKDESETEYAVRYGYRIGEFGFLIGKNSISEVVEDQKVFNMPLADRVLRGLINLRGNLVPVFDIEPLLTHQSRATSRNIILIIGEAGQEVGLTVDELPKPVYDTGSVGQLPQFGGEIQNFISHGITQGGVDWVEFNCQAFFKSFAESKAA